MIVLYIALASLLILLCVMLATEFLAHVSRYRRHMRLYPGLKGRRGGVWRGTR